MKKNYVSIILGFALSFAFLSCGSQNKIYDDFDAAKAQAESAKKDILVVVTVDGEDDYSQKFITEILNNSKFRSWAQKNYVTAHLDFSSETYQKTVAKEDASEAQQKVAESESDRVFRNSNFANTLNVSETPSVYIVTDAPYVITQVNFDAAETSAESFIAELDSLKDDVAEFHKNLDATKEGEPLERVSAIDKIVSATPIDFILFLEDKVQTVIQLDPENKSELLPKYLTLNANIAATKAMSVMDTYTASKTFSDLAKSQFLSDSEKQSAYYNAAYVLTYAAEPDFIQIISLLDAAVQADPQSPDNDDLIEIRNSIEDAMKASLGKAE